MQKELAEQLGLSTADKDKPVGSGTVSTSCDQQILSSFSLLTLQTWCLTVLKFLTFIPPSPAEPEPAQPAQSKTGKYVPPSLRDGGTRRGESMQPNRRGGFKL